MNHSFIDVRNFQELPGRIFRQIFHPVLFNLQSVTPNCAGDFRKHVHPDFELILPNSHTYRCALNRTEIAVRAGEFLLIQPGQLHQDHFAVDAPFRCIHFQIREEGSSEFLARIFAPSALPEDQVAPIPGGCCEETAALLYRAGEQGESQPVKNALFQAFFWQLTAAYPEKTLFHNLGKCTENNILMLRITRCFENALKTGGLPKGILERELHLSTRSVNRICHELLNAPPHHAFEVFRIQRVRQFMLENPGLSIKEIASLFHYANAFHLSRLFRRFNGFPPSKLADKL